MSSCIGIAIPGTCTIPELPVSRLSKYMTVAAATETISCTHSFCRAVSPVRWVRSLIQSSDAPSSVSARTVPQNSHGKGDDASLKHRIERTAVPEINRPPIVGVFFFAACSSFNVVESLAIRSVNRDFSHRIRCGPKTSDKNKERSPALIEAAGSDFNKAPAINMDNPVTSLCSSAGTHSRPVS